MPKLKTKSALPWFGSDASVAEDIAALINHCKHVTIPFVGGASILPHLTATGIVANDRHCRAIDFYRCMSGYYGASGTAELITKCRHTLSHPAELETAATWSGNANGICRAWAFWAQCWIARKGKGGTKGTPAKPSIRRKANGGNNASRIRAAANDLDAWAKQFERCEFECEDFRELLPKVADDATCGLYCDPPWFGAGDQYLYSFTANDHIELRDQLSRFENATVVIRYDDCEFIRDLYSAKTWRIIEAKSRTQANSKIGELWITNNTKG